MQYKQLDLLEDQKIMIPTRFIKCLSSNMNDHYTAGKIYEVTVANIGHDVVKSDKGGYFIYPIVSAETGVPSMGSIFEFVQGPVVNSPIGLVEVVDFSEEIRKLLR